MPPNYCLLKTLFLTFGIVGSLRAQHDNGIDSCNVIWSSPGKSAADSMPLGNGELGINVWVEENGDLLFYLGRNDSYSEISQLCKVGRVRVAISPNPFVTGAPFRQELKLRDGVCEITAGKPESRVCLKVFVDTAHPVVHITGESPSPLAVTATIESWRTEKQKVPEGGTAWTLAKSPVALWQAADVFPTARPDAVTWYHRNEESTAFEATVKVQSLEPIRHTLRDPLIHRTFGGWLTGSGFKSTDGRTIVTTAPGKSFSLRVASPCAQTPTANDWLELAGNAATQSADASTALARTSSSWRSFWERSWVNCDAGPGMNVPDDAKPIRAGVDSGGGNSFANAIGGVRVLGGPIKPKRANMTVGMAHTLQRYMQACAGRGIYPIKFNGSIFTVEPTPLGKGDNPDWRRWGDCHWWQNVRMPYHAMQAAGDFDLMMPLFDMFERIRPFTEARAKLYHNAEGCYFAETMTVWGTYSNGDYGWNRNGLQPKDVQCPYWQFAWNQGLELVSLMLDYHDHTGDGAFLNDRLVPMANSVLRYFDTRFRKDADGHVILDPTQAVETYWHGVINDTPSVAGLNDVTTRLCTLPETAVAPAQRRFFQHMKSAAPPIPIEDAKRNGNDVRRIAVARKYDLKRSNCENPELFPIWPFRIFGLGRPMLEEARNAYALRGSHNDVGWGYDSNAAALLGLTDEVERILKIKMANSNAAYRWPATWGPNFDWLPDHCHGGNLMATIHYMLLQHSGDKILLLPAWPKDWDVSFKLHAPRQTIVEATLRGGKVVGLEVTPESRRKDIVSNLPIP